MGARGRRVSNGELVSVFEQSEEPVLTAPEIADEVGMTRQGVTKRLKKLREESRVERKEAGANAVVWWLV
jgi:predicted transcriptional regulator